MFQSLNLFKSISCPYNSCERPYCQFKHSKRPTPSPTSIENDIEVSEPVSSKVDESQKPTEEINQLPSILENLTSALQSVQKLITNSNIDTTSTSSNEPNKINSSLETLTSAINSLSSNQTLNSNQEKKSSQKRQQSKPTYNPTPIKDLKNVNNTSFEQQDPGNDECELICIKRRKKSDQSEIPEPPVKPSTTLTNEETAISCPKLFKPEKRIGKDSASLSDNKTTKKTHVASKSGDPSKIDMATFGKLTLSQQVQKRYEMLNKTPPTAVSLAEARLKKIQHSLALKAGVPPPKSNVPQRAPKLIVDNTNKIPLAMRQRYLTVIFDNCQGSFATLDKACEKAAEQEKSIYDRSKNKTIYTNLAANLIRGLRNSQQNITAATSSKTSSGSMSLKNGTNIKTGLQKQSHEAMLCGPKANRCTYSINRVKQVEYKDLSINNLYKMFCNYVMTDKNLEDHSFPNWMNENTKLAFIPNFQNKITNPANKLDEAKKIKSELANAQLLTKLCKRCSRTFVLTKELDYPNSNSECIHHWGKLRNVRVDKSIVQKYFCCNGEANETGCEVGMHVYDGEYDGHGTGMNLSGYVETKDSKSDKKHTSENVFALDCEMCYTTKGLEVTRISVIDMKINSIYEKIIKPATKILDYNTRWSGLTDKDLRNCKTTLKDVQNDLLKFFNKDTILLGHSLDSDFKSLKLIHKKVVDTSVVFPHKLGLPYKRALRNLMSEHLQIIIQENAQGHDSKEDANACIKLMEWKINEDLKSSKKLNALFDTSKEDSSQLNVTNNDTAKSQRQKIKTLNISPQKKIN